jgi:hypothetical protein
VTNGTTDDDNWFNVNKGKNGETYHIKRVPLLYQIINGLTDQKGYMTKKLILSHARMRKNPILQNKFEQIFYMLHNNVSDGVYDIPYKGYKVYSLFPEYLGENCFFPDEKWRIYATKPTILGNISHLNQWMHNDLPDFKTAPIEFMIFDKQISRISTIYNRQYGRLITFKSVIDWFDNVRKITDSEIAESMKKQKYDDKIIKMFVRTIRTKKWDFISMAEFGNNSTGTDMKEGEKFLIVFGNWYSGENSKFNGWLDANRNNGYRLTVRTEINAEYQRDLMSLIYREYMEYPLRSRRKKPTYAITNYFQEPDALMPYLIEILKDYNVEIEFY